MVERIERASVVAYRLASHGLSERAAADEVEAVAGRCGIQNTPPGSALLAFHARTSGIEPESIDRAVEDRSLLLTWSMRGAPYYVPTVDVGVFTAGVLPTTEEAARHFVLGVEQSVDRLGMSLGEATDLVAASTSVVLHGRALAIDELGEEVARAVEAELTGEQQEVWVSEGPHAKGQPVGEAVVHFCVRLLALRGLVCFAPRSGNKAPFVLTEEWLGTRLEVADPVASRAELLRRYLRAYGPSTPGEFAAWVGVQAGDVEPWWGLVDDEIAEVDFGGQKWMLAEELGALRSASKPTGVRLLPPRDPYVQVRDRSTIVEEKYQREVWKTVGDPGTVLVDGEIVGMWRPRKSGSKLHLRFAMFGSLTKRARSGIEAEAESIATLRGATRVTVEFEAS
ncbi:winged helix DNA-binding domain-containing protein [Georgenia alba]|uniref:Winged helix DNA-binding domain-containing protein n=1 Tax=Georgenia alba TaxID=2233858 RepID=A0ABW2QBI4_9MICO